MYINNTKTILVAFTTNKVMLNSSKLDRKLLSVVIKLMLQMLLIDLVLNKSSLCSELYSSTEFLNRCILILLTFNTITFNYKNTINY